MDLDYLIQILTNKLATLSTGKTLAFNSGDLDAVNKFDDDMTSTQNTINQLQLVRSLTAAANSVNITPAELIANGLEVSQNLSTVPDNPTGCLSVYDISTYASDPLHEQKIADILESMGEMNSPAVIDAYINSEAISSPVTAMMILNAASQYAVDVRLMMAIMELDSRFGTAGVAVNTLTPGNVGNTGTSTMSYGSWPEGVCAVAEWLSRHRKIETTPETPVIIPPAPMIETPAPVVNPITPSVAPVVPATPLETSNTSTSTPESLNTSTSTPESFNLPAAEETTIASSSPEQITEQISSTPNETPVASSSPETEQASSTTDEIIPGQE